MAIELNGQVDYVSSLHEAVGRRVGPSAGNVDAHRRAPPNYLVVVGHLVGRHPAVGQCVGQALAKQRKRLALHRGLQGVVGGDRRLEHGIADAPHQWLIVADGRGSGYVVLAKLACRVVEVELVEHAVFVVFGKRLPVLGTELLPLQAESVQVGLRGYLFGR